MANQPAAAGLDRMRWLLVLMIFATAAIAVAGGVFWYRNATRGGRDFSSDYSDGVAQEADATPRQPVLTLDPAAFTGEARDAYQIARDKPTLLVQLHCYCGCDHALGHRNLLDCFRDRHASICAICIGEAVDGSQMSKQGSPIEQIRDTLRARYARAE